MRNCSSIDKRCCLCIWHSIIHIYNTRQRSLWIMSFKYPSCNQIKLRLIANLSQQSRKPARISKALKNFIASIQQKLHTFQRIIRVVLIPFNNSTNNTHSIIFQQFNNLVLQLLSKKRLYDQNHIIFNLFILAC